VGLLPVFAAPKIPLRPSRDGQFRKLQGFF
jgi:hypothetical protein